MRILILTPGNDVKTWEIAQADVVIDLKLGRPAAVTKDRNVGAAVTVR